MTKLTSAQVSRLRLQALGVHPSGGVVDLQTPLEVVRHHLAIQSQDWGASRWTIGSRLEGATQGDVLAAYERGEIVRSWPMRGTVHAVVAEDLPWMLDLMGVRALSGVQRRWEYLGIDEKMLERARDVALALLQKVKRCTRAELHAAILDAGIDLAGQRAYHTVWFLAQTGTLVMGPIRGKDQELVLMEKWIPRPRKLSRDDSLAELGDRYFRARGPATLDDLVHWSKLTKGDCRKAIEANRDDLVELHVRGEPQYMPRDLFEQLDPDAKSVATSTYALAAFDEHLLGYRVRDDVLPPHHATAVDPGRNGVFRWTIVAGGQVVATWSRTRRAKHVAVTIKPFGKLSNAAVGRATKAIARYGAFLGTDTRVSVEG